MDESLVNLVMAQFIASAKAGEVVWLTEHGETVGAIAPLDVVRAGLRALDREE